MPVDIERLEKQYPNSYEIDIAQIKDNDSSEKAVFIVDESNLVSDNYHEYVDFVFGTGRLLSDFLSFVNLDGTKRKVIFIGDTYLLTIGKKELSALNPDYIRDEYKLKCRDFQLLDKKADQRL